MGKGKIPPQAIDIEESVLGAILSDKNGIYKATEYLSSEVFYDERNKILFKCIYNLFNSNKPIDLLTVSNELKRVDKLEFIGGDYRLIELTQKIASSAHIEYHCKILLQKYVQRKCISTSSEIIEKSYSDDSDIFELLEKVYKEYGSISDIISVGKVENFKESVINFLNKPKNNKKGIPSSIDSLNKKLNGYQNSDLIILAARPGMGKTAFALNEIISSAINGNPVVFFSLEMSKEQIIGRMLSIISGIDVVKINNFNLSSNEIVFLKECSEYLSNLPIIIDDTGGLSPIELKIKANKYKRENNVKMIVVDYLQLMKIKDKKNINRENEISEISQSLKNIAKDLDVPVIALSQLSRAVETRPTKRPILSDLRDSGAIEQDADIVMFIYRPEYYKIEQWDDDESGSTHLQAEIDVAKYRHGETGYCRVGCELRFMRFMNLNENIKFKIKYQNKQ